jgi:hypothetical protein
LFPGWIEGSDNKWGAVALTTVASKQITALGLVLATLLPLPARADDFECAPKHVPQAEFGPREIGTSGNICPGIPPGEEQSCVVVAASVTYAISVGWLVNKEITPETYSGRLPFGLKWKKTRDSAERKTLRITQGKPEFSKSGNMGFDQTLGSGVCLLSKNGHEYSLELYFDKNAGLSKVVGAILYP